MDSQLPGFTYDFTEGLLRKADMQDKFDINETLLRLGGSPESEGNEKDYVVKATVSNKEADITILHSLQFCCLV